MNDRPAARNRADAGMSANATDTTGKYVTAVNVANGVITVTYGNEANKQIAHQDVDVDAVRVDGLERRVALRHGERSERHANPIGTQAGAPTAYVPPTVIDRYLPSACRL